MVIPVIYNSKVNAVITDTLIGFLIAVLIACGFTFTLSQSDIVPLLRSMIEDFYVDMLYTDVQDWLGPNWEDGLGVYNSYLGMNPGLFEAGRQFVIWAQNQGKLPSSGSVSNPTTLVLNPSLFIPNVVYGNFSFDKVPVIPFASLRVLVQSGASIIYTSPYFNDYITSYSVNNISSIPLNITVNGISYNYTIAQNPITIYYPNTGLNSGSRIDFNIPLNSPSYAASSTGLVYPVIVQRSSSSTGCGLFFAYQSVSGISCLFNPQYLGNPIPIVENTGSASVDYFGYPGYQFDNTNPVYIDLQAGNLSSVISALQNLILQVNDNLVQATIALQEANAGNLPVDTTPFTQLVSSYESVTNDCISGSISISSAISSMYTLLSSSIANITNPSLETACISAYNAFLNKLSLFQSSGSSGTNYTYSTVQTLQSTLDTYYQSYSGGSITYDQMLSTAAGALSTAVSSATSTQELISLNNVYRSFLSRVGADLYSSTYSKDVIDGFHEALDDYEDGTISRSQALSSLKSDYRSGLTGTSSALDVAAITAAYQAAVDQIATSEFTLSTAAGQVSAEAIELEDSIIDEFDYVSLSAMLDFQNWQFFPDQEANLYREYFQRFFSESDSPFYAFLYYPLVLGVAGLILGTGIRFAVRARKSRGSSNVQGGDS